jgi:hypothetical protein
MMYCEHTVIVKEVDTAQSLQRKQDGVSVHAQFEEQLKQSNMKLPEAEPNSPGEKPGNLSLAIASAIATVVALVALIYFII